MKCQAKKGQGREANIARLERDEERPSLAHTRSFPNPCNGSLFKYQHHGGGQGCDSKRCCVHWFSHRTLEINFNPSYSTCRHGSSPVSHQPPRSVGNRHEIPYAPSTSRSHKNSTNRREILEVRSGFVCSLSSSCMPQRGRSAIYQHGGSKVAFAANGGLFGWTFFARKPRILGAFRRAGLGRSHTERFFLGRIQCLSFAILKGLQSVPENIRNYREP